MGLALALILGVSFSALLLVWHLVSGFLAVLLSYAVAVKTSVAEQYQQQQRLQQQPLLVTARVIFIIHDMLSLYGHPWAVWTCLSFTGVIVQGCLRGIN